VDVCVIFAIFTRGPAEQANVFQEVPHLPMLVWYLEIVAASAYKETQVPDVGTVRPLAAEYNL
jgi:hypothetical protein